MKDAEKLPVQSAPGARLLLVTSPYYRAVTDMMQRGAEAAAGAADSERRYKLAWQWADAPLAASRY